ncbi:hypothetical protein K443DRAFT_679810, partial [Laccaria amethystina LaAM-08-1]
MSDSESHTHQNVLTSRPLHPIVGVFSQMTSSSSFIPACAIPCPVAMALSDVLRYAPTANRYVQVHLSVWRRSFAHPKKCQDV